MAHQRTKNFALVLLGVLIAGCAYALLEHIWRWPAEKVVAAVYHKSLAALYVPWVDLFRNSIFTIAFWCAIVLTLILQRLAPAKPDQKIFSPGFAQDLVWFFYQTVLHALIIATYVDLLTRLYAKHFSFLTITYLNQFPGWVRFLLAALLVDLLYWGQHYCNHKVPLLWKLHSLHHSQRELNFFTDFRYHFLEYIVRHTFLVIPFSILTIEAPVIISFGIFRQWYVRFYHGNIKTDLGLLRYILVTPQSHRVHHSVDPAHRDTNFGAILSIWDFALGTQYRKYDVYPDTGIQDQSFPREKTVRLKSLLLTPFHQLLYPFLRTSKPGTFVAESPPPGSAGSTLLPDSGRPANPVISEGLTYRRTKE
jgi:sterol desaturase/sphingolipid hydroxylase (fatty acid hydroxylase superfamily)